jgi:hypothetical protein
MFDLQNLRDTRTKASLNHGKPAGQFRTKLSKEHGMKKKQDADQKGKTTPQEDKKSEEPSFFDKLIGWGRSDVENPEDEMKALLAPHIENIQNDEGFAEYTLLFLVDDNHSIGSTHANRIYNALSTPPFLNSCLRSGFELHYMV